MKSSKYVWLAAFFSFVFLFSALYFHHAGDLQRSPAQVSADGIYAIRGESVRFGAFSGEAWVYQNLVQRKIHFTDFRYQENEIETIWSGTVGGATFDFDLKLSNTLTGFDSFQPAAEQFLAPVHVALRKEVTSQEISYSVATDGDYKETWTRARDATAKPLWQDQRSVTVGVGDQGGLIGQALKLAGIQKVFDLFNQLPEVQKYVGRPEFQKKEQYYIEDKTDSEFYIQNPNVLRLTNKTFNPLAVAEATMRRNAYGHTLAWKEKFLRDQTIRNNFNAAGFLEVARMNSEKLKIGRDPEGDSALWTSMFGWAELIRYQATNDPEALANFKKVVAGILNLVEATGDPKQFARALLVSPPSENLGDLWVQGKGELASYKWLRGGNNDMIKGVFMTLTLAHQILKSDDTVLIERIKRVSQRLYQLDAANDKGANAAMAKGLSALWNQNENDLDLFFRNMNSVDQVIGDITNLGSGIYYGGITDWSGVNLTMTSNLGQILLAKELKKVFSGDALEKISQVQSTGENRLYKMHETYKNAHRDFLTMMIYAFVPQAKENPQFAAAAREAVWALRQVPAPRNIGTGSIDLAKHPEWSISSWPRQPWKALTGFRKVKDNPDLKSMIQGAYSYPLFETLAWSSTYFWKDSPFYPQFSGSSDRQSFSSDYLLIYWASRRAGLISETE